MGETLKTLLAFPENVAKGVREYFERPVNPPRPPLHLRIAITGHRRGPDDSNPKDFGSVEDRLAKVFDWAETALEKVKSKEHLIFAAGRSKLSLLSALAQGVDQIAVDAFRRHKSDGGLIDRRVEAILPAAQDDYAEMIETADDENEAKPTEAHIEAADRMRKLAASADLLFELAEPRVAAVEPTEKDKAVESRWKNQRYAFVGDMLVRQADILIAVWDGVPNHLLGGTAFVIGMALREGLPVIWVSHDGSDAKLIAPPHGVGDRLVAAARDKGVPLSLEAMETLVAGLTARSPLTHDEKHEGVDRFADFYGLKWVDGDAGKVLKQAAAAVRARRRTYANAYKSMQWLFGALPKIEGDAKPDGENHNAHRTVPDLKEFPLLKRWQLGEGLSLMAPTQVDYVRSSISSAEKWINWNNDPNRKPSAVPDPLNSYGEGFALQRSAPDAARQAAALIKDVWATCDAIATSGSHIYRSVYVLTFGLGAAAVMIGLLAAFYEKFDKWRYVLAEFVLLAVVIGVVLSALRWRVHSRYIDARELSEQMRPLWVVAQLGLGGRRVLGDRARWTAWAAQCWASEIGVPQAKATPSYLRATAQNVLETVVFHQMNYHRKNVVRLRLLHRSLTYCANVLLLIAFGMAGIFTLTAAVGALVFATDQPPDWMIKVTTFVCGGFPALAAALAGIKFQGDFERFADRSNVTFDELKRVESQLLAFVWSASMPDGQGTLFNSLRDILLKLEAVLMSDLEDWRFVYHARPIEMS